VFVGDMQIDRLPCDVLCRSRHGPFDRGLRIKNLAREEICALQRANLPNDLGKSEINIVIEIFDGLGFRI